MENASTRSKGGRGGGLKNITSFLNFFDVVASANKGRRSLLETQCFSPNNWISARSRVNEWTR